MVKLKKTRRIKINRNLRTISITQKLFEKFGYAKLVESYGLKMNLNNEDFMYLLLESYKDPPKKKD